MAYAFDQTLNMIRRKKQDGAQSDIFSPEQAGTPGAGEASQFQNRLKRSTSTDIGATSGGALDAGSSVVAPAGQSPNAQVFSGNQAFKSNKGKMGSPVNFANVSKAIKGQTDKAQADADAYVANTGPTELSDTDKSDLGYAIGTETTPLPFATTSTSSRDPVKIDTPTVEEQTKVPEQDPTFWANTLITAPKLYDDFKTDVSGKNYEADMLSAPAGIQQLLMSQAASRDPEYNKGEAAFGSSLLASDPTFNQQAQGVRDQYQALHKKLGTLEKDTETTAQERGNAANMLYKTAITDWLGGQAKGILDPLAGAETDQENAAINFKGSDPFNAGASGQFNSAIAELKTDPAFQGYDIDKIISDAGLAPEQFYSSAFDPNSLSTLDYLSGGNADILNRIGDILGTGGSYTAGKASGKNTKDLVSTNFDKDGLKNAILANLPPPEITIEDGAGAETPASPGVTVEDGAGAAVPWVADPDKNDMKTGTSRPTLEQLSEWPAKFEKAEDEYLGGYVPTLTDLKDPVVKASDSVVDTIFGRNKKKK